ncbi:isochorismatase family protein [Xylariaceae sp. FL0016]|nr:isochorismatase family protein [Xylariaceae sp. FL0016]
MANTALLVLDVQNGIFERMTQATGTFDQSSYFSRLAHAITSARSAGHPIIHVTTAFRSAYPDVSMRNPSFSRFRVAGFFKETDPAVAIHADFPVAETDIQVKKRRVSAWHATELDLICRSSDISKLVIAGFATSGAVLSTVRTAADLDYEIMVLEDLCSDPMPEVHEMLMTKVFPKQGEVMNSEEWLTLVGQ